MAEAAAPCRADASRAVDLPQCPGDAGPGTVVDPHLHEEYVRQLLRQYNEEGLASLRTRAHPGRPPTLTPEDESVVVEIAKMPPRAFGEPFNQWSLRKLTDCLVGRQMIPKVSHVTIAKVLDRHKITYQRTRTWKESKDPDFSSKKNASTASTGARRRTRS